MLSALLSIRPDATVHLAQGPSADWRNKEILYEFKNFIRRPDPAITCNRLVIHFSASVQSFFPLMIRLEICELQIRNDNQDTTHSFQKNRNL